MRTCEHCGEQCYRTHGIYYDFVNMWLCFECFDELRED